MLNAIRAGIFNASTKQRLDELEQRKADIELQILQEEMRHPMLTREDVTCWFCRYRMLDTKHLEERRRLIDGFVNSVIVYDEYIVITFNYKEGTTTVPFSKLDSSDLSSVGGPKTRRWLAPSPGLSFEWEIRRFQYKCPVDTCSIPARRNRHHNLTNLPTRTRIGSFQYENCRVFFVYSISFLTT